MIGPAAHTEITADGAVLARNGQLVAVLLTAGSDAATIVLYDNPSAASGTVLATLKAAANTTAQWSPVAPYAAANGIFADVTGTSPTAYVVFI